MNGEAKAANSNSKRRLQTNAEAKAANSNSKRHLQMNDEAKAANSNSKRRLQSTALFQFIRRLSAGSSAQKGLSLCRQIKALFAWLNWNRYSNKTSGGS